MDEVTLMNLHNLPNFRGVADDFRLMRVSDEEHSFVLQIDLDSAIECGRHQPPNFVYKSK